MKTIPLLSIVAICFLTHCGKAPDMAQNAPSMGPSIPVISTHASPHFMKVASHLELGGSSFNYADQEGFMEALAVILDDTIKSLPAEQRKDIPASFSFVKIFNDLGLNSVKAMGASSRLTDSGLYHSRSFALMPDGKKGLMTLNGGLAEPFLIHQTAPKGTDLALEFPLHLKTLAQESLANFLGMVPEAARADTETQLAQPIPPLGISVRQLIEKLDARLGLFLRVNPDQQLPVPGSEVPLPGLDALIVVDRLGWLLEPLKTQFMPMLQSPALPVEVTEQDGVLTITFRTPLGPAPMDFQPMLRFDSKLDRLMIASRKTFLTTALEGKEMLASDANFKAAWTGLPEKGNSALYVSPVLLKTLRSTMRQSITLSKEPQSYKDGANKVLDFLTPYLSQSQAACTSNQPDGTLGVANLAFPLSNSSTMGTVTTIAIISSLAVPTFNQIQHKSTQVKIGNEGRQLGLALKIYATDHNGQYPASLAVLEQEGLLETAQFSSTQWLYNPTLTETSSPNAILLASQPSGPGEPKRCVVRNDGLSEFISETQFQAEKDENLR